MSRYQFLFFWCTCIYMLNSVRGCERSLEVIGVEDYCWTKKVEVIERLQYTGKSFLNFAKKKLGMDVDSLEEPQKCDYYSCVFQGLKLLNGNGYPCWDKTTTWIKNYVIYNHALILLSQANLCTEGLSNSTISGSYFFGDRVGEDISTEESTTPPESQSKCDIIAEYMKCMSLVEKDEKCPVFRYP